MDTVQESWNYGTGAVDSNAAYSVTNPPKAGITSQKRQSFTNHLKRKHPQLAEADWPPILQKQPRGRKPAPVPDDFTARNAILEAKRAKDAARVSAPLLDLPAQQGFDTFVSC